MQDTYHYHTSWAKIERVFPDGDRMHVLDVGCGDGRVVKDLIKNHIVFGIDGSADAVAAAARLGVRATQADLTKHLPFETGRFDVVLALDILEHLVDVSTMLKELRRVIKHDGYLIISIPNHFDLRTRLELLFGNGIIKWSQRDHEKHAWQYAHLRFWTLREFSRMLREHDLYPDLWQFNFMSQGLLPTGLTPAFLRWFLAARFSASWSGKFLVRCRMTRPQTVQTIIIDRTPKSF